MDLASLLGTLELFARASIAKMVLRIFHLRQPYQKVIEFRNRGQVPTKLFRLGHLECALRKSVLHHMHVQLHQVRRIALCVHRLRVLIFLEQ